MCGCKPAKYSEFYVEALPPTGPDAVLDGFAVGGRGPGARGPADGAEAEGVQPPREHPSQYAGARLAAVIRVDDGQLVTRAPLQVEVVIVGVNGATPDDLQGGVGDTPEQEGGGGSGS